MPVLVKEAADNKDRNKSDTYKTLTVWVPPSAIGRSERISFILFLEKDLFPAKNAATPGLVGQCLGDR